MISSFPAVLNFNWLFLKLNHFICNQLPVLHDHSSWLSQFVHCSPLLCILEFMCLLLGAFYCTSAFLASAWFSCTADRPRSEICHAHLVETLYGLFFFLVTGIPTAARCRSTLALVFCNCCKFWYVCGLGTRMVEGEYVSKESDNLTKVAGDGCQPKPAPNNIIEPQLQQHWFRGFPNHAHYWT